MNDYSEEYRNQALLHAIFPETTPHPDPNHECTPEYACYDIGRWGWFKIRLRAPWSLITDRGWWRRNVTARLNRRRDRRNGADLRSFVQRDVQ